MGKTWGTDPETVIDSDLIIIWGSDPATTSIHFTALVEQARKMAPK
ncbi:MAG: hypothetical protein PWP31_1209 [Clostridia bacterium]|nr:hypothetical protein [Clostridia bacterium]